MKLFRRRPKATTKAVETPRLDKSTSLFFTYDNKQKMYEMTVTVYGWVWTGNKNEVRALVLSKRMDIIEALQGTGISVNTMKVGFTPSWLSEGPGGHQY